MESSDQRIQHQVDAEMKFQKDKIIAFETVVPSLALLEAHLERGNYIKKQGEEWHLFKANGDCIVSGKTIREILINLIWLEC